MRLIDADATKRRVADTYFDTLIPCVNRALDDSPAIDAVPVVRCRECKHYDTADFDGNILCGCTLHSAMLDITPDSFCSYGERKGGAD